MPQCATKQDFRTIIFSHTTLLMVEYSSEYNLLFNTRAYLHENQGPQYLGENYIIANSQNVILNVSFQLSPKINPMLTTRLLYSMKFVTILIPSFYGLC